MYFTNFNFQLNQKNSKALDWSLLNDEHGLEMKILMIEVLEYILFKS